MPAKDIGPGSPHRKRKLAWAKEHRQLQTERDKTWRHRRQEEQAGRPRPEACEICGRVPEKETLHFDHDHQTGEFRGWLCGNCNRSLGLVDDNPEVLRKLADYLEGSRVRQ